MWISMFGGGVCKIQTDNKKFGIDRMETVRELYNTSSIRSIFYAGNDEYWMGIIGFGMILYNDRAHTCVNYQQHPISRIAVHICCGRIIRRKKTGEICFALIAVESGSMDEKNHKVRS